MSFDCPNIARRKDGSRFCKIDAKDLESLARQNYDLLNRLERAKKVYSELKEIARREERLDQTLRDVYDQLRRLRITAGADVGDLRARLEKAKERIQDGLR